MNELYLLVGSGKHEYDEQTNFGGVVILLAVLKFSYCYVFVGES
jgi:hypothetical protein